MPSTKMGKIVDGKQQLRRKAAAKTEKGPLPITEKLKKVSKKFAGLEKMPTFAIPFGKYAEIAQLVEHNLAKVGVASSSLVFRSKRSLREI